jgi:pyruvate dehydrogenase phosphatase
MSRDQTGRNTEEATRIEATHPGEGEDILNKENGRLLGIAVTRAFGDHRWKWSLDLIKRTQELYFGPAPRPKYLTPPYMTAEAVVESTKINTGGKGDFLIMASDGLWDHISSEHAVEAVSSWIAERPGTIKSNTAKAASASSASYTLKDGFAEWKVEPQDFVVEDENAATHLVKNAFGGARRDLFLTVMTSYPPVSRNVRDDVTVHVIFFGETS